MTLRVIVEIGRGLRVRVVGEVLRTARLMLLPLPLLLFVQRGPA